MLKKLMEMEGQNPDNFDGLQVDGAPIETHEQRHADNIAKRARKDDTGKMVMVPPPSYESEVHGAADAGWKNIPISVLPSKGLFYPEGVELTIRSATVGEIRHWSTIDESDELDISEKINYIIEKCSRLRTKDGSMSWKDIKEIDRFFVVFRIQELTFPDNENKLNIKFVCNGGCPAEDPYTKEVRLSSDHLKMLTISEQLMSFYDSDKRCFSITSSKLNETIELHVPSIGTISYVQNYMVEKMKNSEKIDKSFIRYAPFFVSNWRNLNEDRFSKLRVNSQGWHMDKFLIVSAFIDKFKKCVDLNVKHECERCGSIIERPLFFRGGYTIADLFRVSDGLDVLV
jgi:hypothetical protein